MINKMINLNIDLKTYNDALAYFEGREYCGWNDFFAGLMVDLIVCSSKNISVEVTEDNEGFKSKTVMKAK